MIRKLSTKHPPKPVLNNEQLQTLVTDMTETKEVAILGGNRAKALSPVMRSVDPLEAPAVELEANPFSTTTKLGG